MVNSFVYNNIPASDEVAQNTFIFICKYCHRGRLDVTTCLCDVCKQHETEKTEHKILMTCHHCAVNTDEPVLIPPTSEYKQTIKTMMDEMDSIHGKMNKIKIFINMVFFLYINRRYKGIDGYTVRNKILEFWLDPLCKSLFISNQETINRYLSS